MLITIWIWLLVPFSLYCLSMYIKPMDGRRNPRVLLAGIVGLAYAAMFLHATYLLIFVKLPHPALTFRLVRGIVGGMAATILVSMGWPRAPKTMLILSGILFAALPLAMVMYLHWIAPGIALRTIFASPRFYIPEGWPIGLAIPAILMLWQMSGSSAHDDVLPASEHTPQNGTEA